VFGHTVSLFRLFGFEVRINVTWALLAIFIAVSLARGYFPAAYGGWPATTYWWMAAAGIVGVFFSIVLHELAHSLAARAVGMEMRGITLFLFGGVAEMEDEPPSPRAELIMALAGPALSFVLAGLLLGIAAAFQAPGAGATPIVAVVEYLGWLNLVVAIFNMVPAFPLDGGRVLRAILWGLKGDKRAATAFAAQAGGLFGLVLIAVGLLSAIGGAFGQGLWWILIGIFVRAAASSSFQQMEMRRVLRHVTARDLMLPTRDMIDPDISLADLVDRHVYRFHQPVFPVCESGVLIGLVGLTQIKAVPREEWPRVTVGEVMVPVSDRVTVAPGARAVEVLRRLQTEDADGLIVARDRRAEGVLTKADVVTLLGLRMELAGG